MTRSRGYHYVKASELAQLGACERVVRFQVEMGRQETPAQAEAVRRGLAAHETFYAESLAVAARSERKGKCFIATLTLGAGPETAALRAYRDVVLRRAAVGRRFIAVYYRMGPGLCELLRRVPAMQRPVRAALRWLARFAARGVARRIGGTND
jgi:hypothetical protein